MAVAGYFPESELETLRKFGSRLQGHPDLKCPGVEFCGGSLGVTLIDFGQTVLSPMFLTAQCQEHIEPR